MENDTHQEAGECCCQVIALSAHLRDPWACYENDQACCENEWHTEPGFETEDNCCCC